MAEQYKELSKALTFLIEEGRLTPGKRKACISVDLIDYEESERTTVEAITQAQADAKRLG